MGLYKRRSFIDKILRFRRINMDDEKQLIEDSELENNGSIKIIPLVVMPVLGMMIALGANILIPDDNFRQNVITVFTGSIAGALIGFGALFRR